MNYWQVHAPTHNPFGWYAYDAEGIIQTWTQQADSDPVRTLSLGYDAADQLVSAAVSAGGTLLKNHYYGYSAAGNRTSEQIDNQVTAASHNLLNEVKTLSATGPIQFEGGLDEPGTLTINGKTVPLNASNAFAAGVTLAPGVNTVPLVATDGSNNTATRNYQVTIADAQTRMPSYDLNGNLTDDDAGRTFDWDGANRLVKITQGSNVTEFVYDGRGRRVQEKLNGSVIKQWVWDGTAPAEERDASNTVTKRFYAAGEQIGSSAYFFTTDHLGSVREMTDATGAIRARYDYDPYGRTTKVSGNLEADFGFTGFYRHQASGLSLTLYRAYDANLGRWLSRDPIAENGGINLYAYVANNPIGFVDPYGLFLGTPLSAGEFFGSAFSGAGTGLFYAGKGLATAPYRLGQGVVSGYQQIGGLIGDAIVDPTFGSDLSNMASNPWQTTQAAGSAALDIGRGIVQDVKCKAQSSEGRGELWGDLAFATFSGAALNSPNVNVGIAVHGPHHSFGSLGRLSHVQMNWWETGVKGSGGAVRVPLPWR